MARLVNRRLYNFPVVVALPQDTCDGAYFVDLLTLEIFRVRELLYRTTYNFEADLPASQVVTFSADEFLIKVVVELQKIALSTCFEHVGNGLTHCLLQLRVT